MADIAVLHHIGFALDPQLAGAADFLFAAILLEIFQRVDFGPDEAFFKIGVNHPGGLWGSGPRRDGPGSNLFLARREETLESEHAISLAGQHGEGGLGQSDGGEHLGPVGRFEFGDLGLQLRADGHDRSANLCGKLPQA